MIDTLNRLSNAPDGLRFTELKAKLNVSGASLVNRLNKLKDVEYITINAKTGKKSRAHVAYALTQSGVEPVDTGRSYVVRESRKSICSLTHT